MRAVLIHRRNRLQVTFHFPLTAVGRMAYDYCLRLRFSSGPVLCQLFRFVQNQCHGIKVQTVLAVRLFYFLCLPAKPVLDQNRKVLLQGFNLVGLTFILLRDLPVLLHNRIQRRVHLQIQLYEHLLRKLIQLFLIPCVHASTLYGRSTDSKMFFGISETCGRTAFRMWTASLQSRSSVNFRIVFSTEKPSRRRESVSFESSLASSSWRGHWKCPIAILL